MLPNFLIGLREGLEAGLVVGILVAYLGKIGRRDVLPRLWIGVGAAIGISLATGAILTWGPYGLSFQGQEILGGLLSILAVGLVTWMVFWMAGHARDLKHDLQTKLDSAVAGTGFGIILVGFVSVGREGVETALFIWASVKSTGNAVEGTLGALIGILVAIALAYLIYRGFVKINLARFFLWTGVFLVIVAAGVLSYGIGDLQEAGVLPGFGQALFSLGHIVAPTSWYGVILGGVFNFTPEPTALQFAAWLSYLVVVMILFLRQSLSTPPRPASQPQADSTPATPAA